MYRNFICYRGGSSAGILFAEDIYKRAKEEEEAVGRTYYSLYKEDLGLSDGSGKAMDDMFAKLLNASKYNS